ncbi:5-formyltetrahydrofolate cyclo-ligase [Novosphingobium sp. Rr 2-17]|uniref:5-formyltetrahydrofolate cyclo-ligase n=1 Tax=Novosphingobium sp. Rr 2-17 TaxID=555793 RepID=UPI0002698E9A|nr:5-formyltetrahydrofolate cyclo-ligase [Novosphingobium sp. Rr 2-17]EIZ80622.1 5-formyltetrahydrofolate cyclo-ligase [Novosphingobium sp. Rr 2-17]
MVDPSPPILPPTWANRAAQAKAELRRAARAKRAAHVASLPAGLRALMLNRPPAPVLAMIPQGATVGLYFPAGDEAPTLGWARWLSENGRTVALPWFAARDNAMTFRLWSNPWDEDDLAPGPWRALQPPVEAAEVTPDVVVVPGLAFTADGQRLGQGGGHYDRWLAVHPQVTAIGLAWDCQITDELPVEPHDRPLAAVVTPTRIHEAAR